ncbi:MAG: monovalent cation/H+ antiporter subunit D family protein [Methanocellales archaeon]|nr:monovalent cation/H+ antiporter subunit D family protein [Methanocellales archaeon]
MEPVHSIRPVLAILASLICAALIVITGERRRNLREFWTLFASLSKYIIVASMFPLVYHGGVYEFVGHTIVPGIELSFRVDAFGMFFAFLASMLWIPTSIYSIGYVRSLHEHAQTRYFFAFAVCMSSVIGIAFAANLITLYIFYEMLTMATFPLVIHKETPEALCAGKKYLAYTLTGGAFILLGTAITYVLTGTLAFADHGILMDHGTPEMLRALFVIFVIGFGVKAAIMPLHGWLPSAMVAPTPVSALLHAVAVVKAGVFGLIRVVYYIYGVDLMRELGLGLPLAVAASITIIVGSVLALKQDNLKKLLAYSTVSQLSYIVLGAALLTPSATAGGIIHIANQAFMKITLFFCAGAIFVQTGKKNISEMNGIGKTMPLTMICFSIAATGMIGVPLLCGFITKWYLCVGALEAGYLIFIGVLLVSALLNVAYFFPIIYNAFFMEPEKGAKMHNDPNWWILLPIVICTLGVVILGVTPSVPYTPLRLATIIVQQVLG